VRESSACTHVVDVPSILTNQCRAGEAEGREGGVGVIGREEGEKEG
jgi:hypothetical protein